MFLAGSELAPSLSTGLDLEWASLRRRPCALRAVRRWQLLDVPIGDLDAVLVACGYRVAPSSAANVVLTQLVERARRDELAARIVLQRLLPGLLATIRRRADGVGSEGMFEELAGAAWISIRTTNITQGSPSIAAALISDSYHRAFVAPRRRRVASELALDPGHLEQTPAPTDASAFDELVGIVGEARRGGLPDEDLELVTNLLRAGSARELAVERNVTPRTVRNHRARAAHRILRLTAAA